MGVRAVSDTYDVIMAAYEDTGTAGRDFDRPCTSTPRPRVSAGAAG